MAETLPPEAASVQTEPGQGTSPFSEKYDPQRTDYLVKKEGDDVVIRDPLLMNLETKEYEVVGRLTGTKEGTIPGVSAQAEALRSITSQVPDAERDIRNQFLAFKEEELGVEPNSTPEWLVSSERGRWLVEQVAYMETELTYDERWNEKNAPILYELSRKLTVFIENTKQRDRYLQDHFDPESEHKVKLKPDEVLVGEALHQAIKEAYEERLAKGVAKAKKADDSEPVVFTEIEVIRHENLATLTLKYMDLHLSIPERKQVKEDLLKYFEEAHRKGLLKETDEIYSAIYLGFRNKTYTKNQALALLAQREPEARQALEDALLAKAEDPDVNPRLLDIETAYILWTRGKLRQLINGENPGPYKEGEWRIPGEEGEEEESTELYWNPYGGYPNYYEIKARTPAQFRIAKESFLQMLKNKALGYDPNELMQNLINFKQVLSARGTELALEHAKLELQGKNLGADKITPEFMEELRQEFEGRAFLWHTFYNTQAYNKEGAKQGAMAMAMHEGPQRWARALRSGEQGGVGFHTWSLDNNALHEFALNAQGSRGQFGRRTQVHEFIRSTVKEMEIERGMGVVLKDYDWRDVDLVMDPDLRLKRAKRLEQLDKHLRENNDDLDSFEDNDDEVYYEEQNKHAKTNQERIGIHQSDEALKALYECFDEVDAHRNNYKKYIENNGWDIDHLPADFPKKLRESVRVGKVQTLMDQLRLEVRGGKISLGRNEKLIDKLEKGKDKKLYEKFYADSEASFEVAVQMQGVTHESTIRGGGVYFVHRNQYVRQYLEFRQEHRHVQKAKDPDISEWSPEERKKTFSKAQYIGWIISETHLGKKFDDFTLEEKYLYYDVGSFDRDGKFQFKDQITRDQVTAGTFSWIVPLEREYLVDHIPTHLVQKAGMAVVNWVRMQYADDAQIWNRPELKAKIEEKNSKGNFKNKNFKAIYRAAVIEDTLNRAADQIEANGHQAKFFYADYDLVSFDFREGSIELKARTKPSGEIDLKPIKLKKPRIFGYTQNGLAVIAFDENRQPVFGFDTKGRVYLTESDKDASGQFIIYDKPSGKDQKGVNLENIFYKDEYNFTERKDDEGVSSFVSTQEIELDLQTAAESYLALHTAHTYWAYQSNNTHTLLPEYVFEQARQIRDGKLRPEDADILAGLLLTVDPTLSRVKSFDGDNMALEALVFDAAVEESLQNWVGMRDVFKGRFLPSDGNVENMATGYYTEDQGGDFRFSLQNEALFAKMPKRWARRFAAVLRLSPIHADTMAGNLGRKGVMGAVSMMDDKIQELTTQRIASQFAITKFINLMDSSTNLWFRLVGGTDPKTGEHHEGLFMKPTNNADKLAQLRKKIPELDQLPNAQDEGFYALLDSFGRAWDTLKAIRTMYSDNRNAGGALDLRKVDVFLPNGRFNPAIAKENERYTGTSRHIAKKFWGEYVDWLMDERSGGGQQAYGEVAYIYKMLKNPFLEDRWVDKGELFVNQEGTTIRSGERQLVTARDIKLEEIWVEAGEIYLDKDGKKMRSNERQLVIARDSNGRTWADWLSDKMVL